MQLFHHLMHELVNFDAVLLTSISQNEICIMWMPSFQVKLRDVIREKFRRGHSYLPFGGQNLSTPLPAFKNLIAAVVAPSDNGHDGLISNSLKPKFNSQSQINVWDLDVKAQGFF